MANNLNTNPIVIDTFNADFALPKPITVRKVVLRGGADGDIFALENGQADTGTPAIILEGNANLESEIDFNEGFTFTEGLFFDASDTNTGLDSSNVVLIYLK